MPTPEELLSDVLDLHVQDDPTAPALPIERLGAGYQSLLRLAVLRTFAEMADETRPAIFLIEEPEAYLNPHLRRFFASTLRELARAGNEVVVTTHDPAFVDLTEHRTVARVAKPDGQSRVYRSEEPLDFSYEHVAKKLRRNGNGEVLLAALAILCEGEDDVAVVRTLLDELTIDPDSRNVSVVDCGGRDQLPDYVRLLDALHIPLMVVTDGDATTAATDPQTKRKVEAVASVAGDRAYRFTEDIETALACQKTSDNTAHLVAITEQLDLDQLPPNHEIAGLVAKLRAFCAPQGGSAEQS